MCHSRRSQTRHLHHKPLIFEGLKRSPPNTDWQLGKSQVKTIKHLEPQSLIAQPRLNRDKREKPGELAKTQF
jgi:hypothetical protein